MTLSMIQNFLIPQMFKDQVLDIFFSEIPLKIRQEGPKNVSHSGFCILSEDRSGWASSYVRLRQFNTRLHFTQMRVIRAEYDKT